MWDSQERNVQPCRLVYPLLSSSSAPASPVHVWNAGHPGTLAESWVTCCHGNRHWLTPGWESSVPPPLCLSECSGELCDRGYGRDEGSAFTSFDCTFARGLCAPAVQINININIKRNKTLVEDPYFSMVIYIKLHGSGISLNEAECQHTVLYLL